MSLFEDNLSNLNNQIFVPYGYNNIYLSNEYITYIELQRLYNLPIPSIKSGIISTMEEIYTPTHEYINYKCTSCKYNKYLNLYSKYKCKYKCTCNYKCH